MKCKHRANISPRQEENLTTNIADYIFLLNSCLTLKLQNNNESKTGDKDQKPS